MLRRTLDYFCGYYIALIVALALVMLICQAVVRNLEKVDERSSLLIITIAFAAEAAAALVVGIGWLVAHNYRRWHDEAGWFGLLLSIFCLTVTVVVGFVDASAKAQAYDSYYPFAIISSAFGAAISITTIVLIYQLRSGVTSERRRVVERAGTCVYLWLGLSLLGAPGLWLYFDATIVRGWSLWWTPLILIAYAGVLRLLVPIVAQFLKWPIITEEQMSS